MEQEVSAAFGRVGGPVTASRLDAAAPKEDEASIGGPSGAAKVETVGPRNLTKRERDVLHWLAQGKSGAETAQILGISLCTVRVHIRNMLKKLGAANIAHAVARAFQLGMLDR